MTQIEQFGWTCGYEQIYGNYQVGNDRCNCKSVKTFDLLQDAVKDAINHCHTNYTYIHSDKRGYVGLAVGLNFHDVHN
jgi:hypothetical protein